MDKKTNTLKKQIEKIRIIHKKALHQRIRKNQRTKRH